MLMYILIVTLSKLLILIDYSEILDYLHWCFLRRLTLNAFGEISEVEDVM